MGARSLEDLAMLAETEIFGHKVQCAWTPCQPAGRISFGFPLEMGAGGKFYFEISKGSFSLNWKETLTPEILQKE